MGINDYLLDGTENIVSNASCTTNSAAPMIKLIDENLGIESAYITTIHSYTTDQRLRSPLIHRIDLEHGLEQPQLFLQLQVPPKQSLKYFHN